MSRVTVDPGRCLGQLDRNVFGGFVEHLGRCINGGLFEEGSPLSDSRGFRTDVVELLRPLRLSVLRWPGGNFVSNYLWTDGIGPRDARPARLDLAWGAVEPNRFGTDEFLQYCAELGASPYICLNMGTGDLSEALAWVEYCNSSARSYWAERRRDNGHDAAYGVPYWGLGNEVYGDWQVGQMSADEYVREATRWAKAIRRLDPAVKLVSCGLNGWDDWDRVVIDAMVPLVDLHSLHIYTGADDYWANVLSPHQAQRAITHASSLISRAVYNQGLARTPRLAYDEWNVWYRTADGTLEERYSFPDALAVATYLNIFVRNCDWVRMANLAQMVNAIAPVVTTPTASFVQPIYYPVMLHANAALRGARRVRHLARSRRTGAVGALAAPGRRPRAVFHHRCCRRRPTPLAAGSPSPSSTGTGLATRSRYVSEDAVFDGEARVTTLTASPGTAGRPAPDIEGVKLEEGTETAKEGVLVVLSRPLSFTVVEAGMAGTR